jgi:adenylylsulfate kinase
MGLAGAGKSALGLALANRLKHRFGEVIWLDGDALRKALAIEGHSKAIRIEAGIKYLEIAKLLVPQCNFVVLSSIGLQKPFEEYAKRNFSKYFQVLVDAEIEILAKERDLYQNPTGNIIGVDLQPDRLNFDLILRNDRSRDVNSLALQLEQEIENWIRP